MREDWINWTIILCFKIHLNYVFVHQIIHLCSKEIIQKVMYSLLQQRIV